MSEFKYGDMVEVRDSENQDWQKPRFYLGAIPLPNGKVKHYTLRYGLNESDFRKEIPISWNYIRKPEPKP